MKSQSELLGLAMVMVLIVLGLLIFVTFAINDSKTASSVQIHKQLPVITNDVILFTEVAGDECYGERMRDLIIRVAQRENFVCNNNQQVSLFVREKLQFMLDESLGAQGLAYNYSVYVGDDFSDLSSYVLSIESGDCDRKDRNSEIFFFPLRNGQRVNMKLDLCS